MPLLLANLLISFFGMMNSICQYGECLSAGRDVPVGDGNVDIVEPIENIQQSFQTVL